MNIVIALLSLILKSATNKRISAAITIVLFLSIDLRDGVQIISQAGMILVFVVVARHPACFPIRSD